MAAQQDRDQAWAAAVLEGTVVTRGPWRDSRQRARQGGSSASAGDANKAPRRHSQQQQQRQQQQRQMSSEQQRHPGGRWQQHNAGGTSAAAAGAASAAAAAGGGDTLPAYSQPGPRSTARVAHCQACDVWVHTAGIRHRRQLLSLRVHGERNRLVLSAFESPPDSPEAAQRLVGRAAADFGLAQPSSGAAQQQQAAPPPSPELLQAARRLRTQALKQLLNMFGVGQLYSAAGAGFEERLLASCLQQAARRVGGEVRAPPVPGTAAPGAACFECSTGAQLAVAAHWVVAGRWGDAELVSIACSPPADAPRSQHAGLAAAVPLVLCALRRGRLASLRLRLPGGGGDDDARLAHLWQRAWQHALPALRDLLGSSVPLRDLRLALPGCLRDATEAYLRQLQAAAAAAAAAVRAQVLLGLHPRLGRCSLLQLLPLAVVREVLDLAAPLQPCAVHIEWLD
ncbi:expressed protein [Chlorella variabilis]|uniref:Expressed protein n=1 Tax=Chlorella variabilis TaxID=554065 RepID=E1ZAD5_CHLVA|nr:expressed protein [Chlorella variabilis]EFN57243.1 expressed protein [Chlorella variabilis]|eukprot:XP_005849345.1 expressed protein [Chlorella variabilis]